MSDSTSLGIDRKLGFFANGHGAGLLPPRVFQKATFLPDPVQCATLQARYEKFRGLYPALRNLHWEYLSTPRVASTFVIGSVY